MAYEDVSLSDAERAELEALRADRRQEAARARRQEAAQATAAEDRRIAEARARGSRLMEPDDDLRMPLGQKIVLGVLALLVAIVVAMTVLVG